MIQPIGHNYAVKCNGCGALGPVNRDVWEAERLAIAAGFVVTRSKRWKDTRAVERDDCGACHAARMTANAEEPGQ